MTADGKLYDKLVKSIPTAGPMDPTVNSWIRVGTWSLIGDQTWLQQNGKLGNDGVRNSGNNTKASRRTSGTSKERGR